MANVMIVSLAVALLAGCAGAPPRGPHRDMVPQPTVINMDGVIVDVRADAGTLTVKEDQAYDTWTVAVEPGTRIRGADALPATLADLKIGDRARIIGSSRVSWVMTASEIEVLKAVRSR